MGKHIPKSRKHKKLKFVDPAYTGVQLHSKKKKLLPNEPPTGVDRQHVPRRMTEVINIKNKIKAGKIKKKKKKKKKVMKDDFIVVRNEVVDDDTQGATKPVRKLPAFVKQKSNESEEKFFNRLQRMADIAIAEAKVEQKYGIEVVNVDKKGNAQYVTAPKEITEKQREKRRQCKERVDEKKKLKADESTFNLQKEKIEFNDVVLAPPIFTSKPRKAPATNKAGKKQLFLKNILGASKTEGITNPKPLSTKWKNIPTEKRKILENERSRAVQMYRMIKNKKLNN